MIALGLYFSLLVSPLAIVSPNTRCEELGPRRDGSYVTVCDGPVVRVRDDRGNSRDWDLATNTVTVRARGAAPLVLARPGRW